MWFVLLIYLIVFNITLINAADYFSDPEYCITGRTGERQDCGYFGITEEGCAAKGCCWNPKPPTMGGPWCFFPNSEKFQTKFVVHKVNDSNPHYTDIDLTLVQSFGIYKSTRVPKLKVRFYLDHARRVRIKITDPENNRHEVPEDISPVFNTDPDSNTERLYKIDHATIGEKWWFSIHRVSDNEVLFNTKDLGFDFANQFIQISTKLPNPNAIFGLGDTIDAFKKKPQTYTLFNYDVPTPKHTNLYGSHPVYLAIHENGNAHIVYLRNSHGMDIEVEETFLSFKANGGIIDLFVTVGPGPKEAISQYGGIVGYPALPPFWSLGFHQCRYGYRTVEEANEVRKQYEQHNIPLDVMWNDIDYMQDYRDFTFDKNRFPPTKVKAWVDDLHVHDLKFVPIVDPGIQNNKPGYKSYEIGKKMDVFIKDFNGNEFEGLVWPGKVAFPDFLHPNAVAFWKQSLAGMYDQVPMDGLWIDMNEASSFCNGPCNGSVNRERTIKRYGYDFKPNNPPYRINNQLHQHDMWEKTIAMDSIHYGGTLEYEVHNLYGISESKATQSALIALRHNRTFIISRSTFPGSGVYAGHWQGDNHATWESMKTSIATMLNFQIYQIPMVGADICGFQENTNEELCGRWIALGAFYPFSRNHNQPPPIIPQELYRWESVANIGRKYLNIRYQLATYYYTLFFEAHTKGYPVINGLQMVFPEDRVTHNIDTQFMVGECILITPVLEANTNHVNGYFPKGRWFDIDTYAEIDTTEQGGASIKVPTPSEKIGVHLRGGCVIPMYLSADKTIIATKRNKPIQLVVVLNENKSAKGLLFLDNGEDLQLKDYTVVHYSVFNNEFKATINSKSKYDQTQIDSILILGLLPIVPIDIFTSEGQTLPFIFDYETNKLLIKFNKPVASSFNIKWTHTTIGISSDPHCIEGDEIILMTALFALGSVSLMVTVVVAFLWFKAKQREKQLHYHKIMMK